MIVIICHNTDLGDGWEREGENEWYFHEFSEKKAYPLGNQHRVLRDDALNRIGPVRPIVLCVLWDEWDQ